MSKRVLDLNNDYRLTIMNDYSSMKNYFTDEFYREYLFNNNLSKKVVYCFDKNDIKNYIVIINDDFYDKSQIFLNGNILSYGQLNNMKISDLDKIFDKILKRGSYYLILKNIINGTVTDDQFYKLEKDDFVGEIFYSRNNPRKSKIKINMGDITDVLKSVMSHMYNEESDFYLAQQIIYGSYSYSNNNGYYSSSEKEYYIEFLNKENLEILINILKLTDYDLYQDLVKNGINDNNRSKIWDKYIELEDKYFSSYSTMINIVEDHYSNVVTDGLSELIHDQVFSIFKDLQLFPLPGYYNKWTYEFMTSVKNIVRFYDKHKLYDNSVKDIIKYILKNDIDVTIGDWDDDTYRLSSFIDFDTDQIQKEFKYILETILDEIESDESIIAYKDFYEKFDRMYPNYKDTDKVYSLPDKNYVFKINEINPSNNKIIITVINQKTLKKQQRQYNVDNFIDFLTSYELFKF